MWIYEVTWGIPGYSYINVTAMAGNQLSLVGCYIDVTTVEPHCDTCRKLGEKQLSLKKIQVNGVHLTSRRPTLA